MENLVRALLENMVLEELKGYNYIRGASVLDKIANLCNTSQELEIAKEIIFSSKRYNSIVCQNGASYIFGKTAEDIELLVNEVPIPRTDRCWDYYVYCDGRSYPLKYFVR